MLFAVTFQHRQRGCSYHGDPVHVSVHAGVCVSVPVCDWLMGQGGWAGGASESIFLPQTRTERQRDTDLLTALSSSLHLPPFPPPPPPSPLPLLSWDSLSISLLLSIVSLQSF